MALSNIGNEPRREITEQIVGVALFAIFIAVDYGIVWGLGAKNTQDWIFGMLLVGLGLPFVVGMFALLIVALHGLGDLVCDGLGAFGIDPRPKQRYRR